ncbi:MAG: MerR family transcriptional regulator [Spirochaetota bacterium]
MYPIQVVSRKTGISCATLRAWERRYASVRPTRDANGRRQYNDSVLQHLLVCSNLISRGYRIGDIVDTEPVKLAQLYHSLRDDNARDIDEFALARDDLVDATRRFDERYIHQLINDALLILGRTGVVDGFAFPLEAVVRDEVERGSLQRIHESWLNLHLYRALASFIPSTVGMRNRPRVVIAVPGPERHDLGLVGSAIHADAAGWAPVLIGSAPSEQLASALKAMEAEAAVLVVVTDMYDIALRNEVLRLKAFVDIGNRVIFGGRMPDQFRDDLIREGLEYAPHMRSLQERLSEQAENRPASSSN